MLTIKEKGTLLIIIKHCHRIEEKIEGVSFEAFLNNEDVKEIISFNILQIGELAKNLSPEFLRQHPNSPWKSIKGMRDVVAHGYGMVRFDRIWETASEEVKPLREYCEQIIKENS